MKPAAKPIAVILCSILILVSPGGGFYKALGQNLSPNASQALGVPFSGPLYSPVSEGWVTSINGAVGELSPKLQGVPSNQVHILSFINHRGLGKKPAGRIILAPVVSQIRENLGLDLKGFDALAPPEKKAALLLAVDGAASEIESRAFQIIGKAWASANSPSDSTWDRAQVPRSAGGAKGALGPRSPGTKPEAWHAWSAGGARRGAKGPMGATGGSSTLNRLRSLKAHFGIYLSHETRQLVNRTYSQVSRQLTEARKARARESIEKISKQITTAPEDSGTSIGAREWPKSETSAPRAPEALFRQEPDIAITGKFHDAAKRWGNGQWKRLGREIEKVRQIIASGQPLTKQYGNVKFFQSGPLAGLGEFKFGNGRTSRVFFRYLPETNRIVILTHHSREAVSPGKPAHSALKNWLNNSYLESQIVDNPFNLTSNVGKGAASGQKQPVLRITRVRRRPPSQTGLALNSSGKSTKTSWRSRAILATALAFLAQMPVYAKAQAQSIIPARSALPTGESSTLLTSAVGIAQFIPVLPLAYEIQNYIRARKTGSTGSTSGRISFWEIAEMGIMSIPFLVGSGILLAALGNGTALAIATGGFWFLGAKSMLRHLAGLRSKVVYTWQASHDQRYRVGSDGRLRDIRGHRYGEDRYERYAPGEIRPGERLTVTALTAIVGGLALWLAGNSLGSALLYNVTFTALLILADLTARARRAHAQPTEKQHLPQNEQSGQSPKIRVEDIDKFYRNGMNQQLKRMSKRIRRNRIDNLIAYIKRSLLSLSFTPLRVLSAGDLIHGTSLDDLRDIFRDGYMKEGAPDPDGGYPPGVWAEKITTQELMGKEDITALNYARSRANFWRKSVPVLLRIRSTRNSPLVFDDSYTKAAELKKGTVQTENIEVFIPSQHSWIPLTDWARLLRWDGQEPRFSKEAAEFVEKHFRNLKVLTEKQKITLYYIVTLFHEHLLSIEDKYKREFYDKYHAAKKLPKFVEHGITFIILGKDQKQTDLPELSRIKGKKMREVYPGYKDNKAGNRLADEVRGEGSHRLLVIPEESLRDSITGSYSIAYHEFAHLLHLTALTPKQVAQIENLYQHAKENDLFLDDYAAENEWEYFAQGVEAFVSKTKNDKSWGYYKHERQDLLDKDPDLYWFIRSLISRNIS